MKKKQAIRTAVIRVGAVILALCLVAAIVIPAFAAEDGGSRDFVLRIVHTNDIHARVEEGKDGSIGVPRLAAIIEDYTSGADMDLVLDSGDLFHGLPIATLVKGESIARIAGALGYDAMTAGNHDWSYGADRLKELCGMASLTMLTGNVVDEAGEPFFESSVYTESVTVDGKELKVGVFGVIDPALYQATTPVNVAGLTFTDPAAYANAAAAALREQDCDVVIALAHAIAPADLAAQVDGVDLWLAGHEHISMNQTVATPDGGEALVVESGYYLKTLSLIEITATLDAGGDTDSLKIDVEPVDVEAASAYEPDLAMTALLANINAEQEGVREQVVGQCPEELPNGWEDLRIAQQKIGNVATDAYLLETGADIAVENAGGIRGPIPAGDVTYGDMLGVFPYSNTLVTKALTGRELYDMMEISTGIQMANIASNEAGDYDGWVNNSGNYLQFGGMTMKLTPVLKDNVMTDLRIDDIQVGGEPLDLDKTYTVAVNSYLATLSDYPMLAAAKEVGQFTACDEVLGRFFQQDQDKIAASIDDVRQVIGPPVYAGTEPLPFTDVDKADWFYDAVVYAYRNGLMNGVSANRFAPGQPSTRAQFVTVLWRLEGKPKAKSASFTDIASGAWYAEAVNWAAETGITTGTGAGRFLPDGRLTREQMSVFLWRYAKYKGQDVSANENALNPFSDAASVSGYALEAMRWAVDAGILEGVGKSKLAPKGNLTRAQMATVLRRMGA